MTLWTILDSLATVDASGDDDQRDENVTNIQINSTIDQAMGVLLSCMLMGFSIRVNTAFVFCPIDYKAIHSNIAR